MPRKSLPIDIRDKRLRTGRLAISSRTTNPKERERREAHIRTLMRKGRIDIVERLRDGHIHIETLCDAVEDKDYARLEAPAEEADPRLPILTLQEALDRIIARTKGAGVKGTITARRSLARQFGWQGEEPSTGAFDCSRRLDDFMAKECEDFVFGVKKNGKPWGSVRQEAIRYIGQIAWDTGIADEAEQVQRHGGKPRLTINPFRKIKVAGKGKNRMARVAFLQRSEWREVERANVDLPELGLVAVGALAGLREGEAAHLRLDVDLLRSPWMIRIQPRAGTHPWTPKTQNSIRDVPVNDRLRAILERHIELGFAGKYVFHVPGRDRPMWGSTCRLWTRRAFERAGIKYGREGDGYTNHTLRHSFASWLAQEDVQLKKIGELIGDTYQTVDRFYAGFLPTDHDRTVRILDTLLDG